MSGGVIKSPVRALFLAVAPCVFSEPPGVDRPRLALAGEIGPVLLNVAGEDCTGLEEVEGLDGVEGEREGVPRTIGRTGESQPVGGVLVPVRADPGRTSGVGVRPICPE